MQEGKEMYGLVEKIFPICRSITGNGVRKTLQIMKEYAGILMEIPSASGILGFSLQRERGMCRKSIFFSIYI